MRKGDDEVKGLVEWVGELRPRGCGEVRKLLRFAKLCENKFVVVAPHVFHCSAYERFDVAVNVVNNVKLTSYLAKIKKKGS